MLPTPLSPSVSSMSTFCEKIGLARRLFSVFCSFLINVTMEYDIHAIPCVVSLHGENPLDSKILPLVPLLYEESLASYPPTQSSWGLQQLNLR